VTCAFLQQSNVELYARFGSELLKPFLKSLANQQHLKDGFQSPEPSHLVGNSSSAAGLTAGGGDDAPNHAPAVTTALLREPVSRLPFFILISQGEGVARSRCARIPHMTSVLFTLGRSRALSPATSMATAARSTTLRRSWRGWVIGL